MLSGKEVGEAEEGIGDEEGFKATGVAGGPRGNGDYDDHPISENETKC